jgi:ParB-like chromosome segregation protein Spo0J
MSGHSVLSVGPVLGRPAGVGAVPPARLDHLPIVMVAVSALIAADSPRREGENLEHARTLAEADEALPPIVVHRPTMRVIDGMHRLLAAKLRGNAEIEARFVEGDEASAFVLAVSENVRHGLPLSLADRKAAAERIIACYPQWSDRMVGSVTCLSAKTVATLRQHADHIEVPLATMGRDGRVRPRDGEQRRQIARELMLADPSASLRKIAQQAGISPETARHVRMQLNHPDGAGIPAPDGDQITAEAGLAARLSGLRAESRRANRAIEALKSDPSFRSTETGRSLLRMLAACQVLGEHGAELIEHIPTHCLERVAAVADACITEWQAFAEQVEQRKRTSFEGERIA